MGFKAIILTPIKCGDIIPPCDLGFPIVAAAYTA